MSEMLSDKNEPVRITGSCSIGGSVILVNLIKSVSVRMDIYVTSESAHCVKSAPWSTRENVEESVANLMCLPVYAYKITVVC